MVRQLRQVPLRIRDFTQRGEDADVKEPAAQRRNGRQDGLASQFMAEGKSVAGSPQQAPGDALVDFVEDRTGNTRKRSESIVEPMTEATSRTARASGESRAARARMASPTVAGTASPSLARASVTKNGLPPVNR